MLSLLTSVVSGGPLVTIQIRPVRFDRTLGSILWILRFRSVDLWPHVLRKKFLSFCKRFISFHSRRLNGGKVSRCQLVYGSKFLTLVIFAESQAGILGVLDNYATIWFCNTCMMTSCILRPNRGNLGPRFL